MDSKHRSTGQSSPHLVSVIPAQAGAASRPGRTRTRAAGAASRGPRTSRLTAAQAHAAVLQIVRVDRGEVDRDKGMLAEIAKSKGYALVATQAAYEALARAEPVAVVKAIRDFLRGLAADGVAEELTEIALLALDAMIKGALPPENTAWIWDEDQPSCLLEALRFAVLAAQEMRLNSSAIVSMSGSRLKSDTGVMYSIRDPGPTRECEVREGTS